MRNIRTIVAVAATIIMLGAVAQAQTPTWTTGSAGLPINVTNIADNLEYGFLSSGNVTFTGNPGTVAKNISSFYMGGSGNINATNVSGGGVTIANYYATSATLSKVFGGNSSSNMRVTDFYLQTGIQNLNGQNFGVDNVNTTVTAKVDGISIGSTNNGITATSGKYTVHNVGTLGTLELFGGNVQNDSRINNLIFGSGTYTASEAKDADGNLIATVGTLSFTAEEEFRGEFKIGSIVAESYNLANANLVYDFADDPIVAGNYSFGFGDDVKWDGFESLTFTAAGLNDLVFSTFGTQQWGDFFVTFTQDGASIAAVPEPATLAVLGLGLAGLGLARRRRK